MRQTIDVCAQHEVQFFKGTCDICKLRYLLYEAIVELEYVQCVENCNSGLCATPQGERIVNEGMKLLGVKDLSAEHLDVSNG